MQNKLYLRKLKDALQTDPWNCFQLDMEDLIIVVRGVYDIASEFCIYFKIVRKLREQKDFERNAKSRINEEKRWRDTFE